MKIDQKIQSFFSNRYVAWSICIVIVGTVFFFNAISIPELGGDGVKYLSVAENIYEGKGITFGWDDPQPWVGSPPLFSVLISLFMHLGLSSLDSSNIISSLFFSGCLVLVFLIACHNSNRLVGYLSLAICATSQMMWHITHTVSVDILLIFFLLAAIFYLIKYTQNQNYLDLLICSFFIALSILTKNTAYLFLLSVILVIVISNERLITKIFSTSIIIIISTIPALIVNTYLSKFIPVAEFLSPTYERVLITQTQIILSFISTPIQFWGINIFTNAFAVSVFLLFLITIIIVIYKNNISFSSLLIPDEKTKIILIFIIIYYFGLLVILVRSGIPFLERYSAPVFLLIIIYIVTVIYQLCNLKLKIISTILILSFMAVFIIFIHISLISTINYYQTTSQGYIISHPVVRADIPLWADIGCNKDFRIFTNDPYIVGYYCHRNVDYLPRFSNSDGVNAWPMYTITSIFSSFNERTYIIVFKKIYHLDFGAPYESYIYYNSLHGNITKVVRDHPDLAIFRPVKDESGLHIFSIPEETNNIKFFIESQNITNFEWNKRLSIYGWAFLEDRDNADGEKYVSLESENDTYIFDTFQQAQRTDVTEAYKNLNLNLDNSGFHANIPLYSLQKGIYRIGIILNVSNTTTFVRTNNYITN